MQKLHGVNRRRAPEACAFKQDRTLAAGLHLELTEAHSLTGEKAMDVTLMLVIVLVVVALLAGWFYMQKRRSQTLRGRFGPEYEETVQRYGNRTRAETDLERRVKRVERFHIRPLDEHERESYLEQWRRSQAHFVDNPGGAIAEADKLVCDVMKARGYPMSEFENRAEDLSVDHPRVVSNYRAAHEIAERHSRGEADTEQLRRAFVHYRELFADLMEPHTMREELHR
jgi:hypothetical protein